MRNARDAAPAAEGETSSSVVESPTSTPATPSPPIKMEVGIEDCLHIELEYDRPAYGLTDTILGRVHFLLVRRRRAARRAKRRAVVFSAGSHPPRPHPPRSASS